MNLAISARNYRGIEVADIQVSPIALLCGLNGAGKSSILEAAASALTHDPMVLGIPKKDAKRVLTAGSDEGRASIVRSDKATATVTWPGCDVHTDGPEIKCSVYAAGLESVADMKQKDRAAVLADYLKAAPTFAQFNSQMKDCGLSDERIKQLWTDIEMMGWDAVHKTEKEKGTKLSGAWEHITGERYGVKKAEGWSPEDYDPIIDNSSVEELETDLKNAETAFLEAEKSKALSEEQLRQLRAQSKGEDKIKQVLEDKEAKVREIEAALEDKIKEIQEIPVLENKLPECPHCKGALRILQSPGKTVIEKATQISDEQVAATKAKLEKLWEEKYTLDADLNDAKESLNKIKADLQTIKDAQETLENLDSDQTPEADKDGVADSLKSCETRLKMRLQKDQARAKHVEVVDQMKVVKVLEPQGLRKVVLGKAIEDFNRNTLDPICVKADFSVLALDADMNLFYGGRPYDLLSASEKFRCRVVLQIAMAHMDKSEIVLLDGIDVLDASARNGLVSLLSSLNVNVLCACTIPGVDMAPDLAAAELGQTYWIEDGRAHPLQEAKTAVQAA